MNRILALEIVAFWPVWIWWARRVAGDAEAAWGLAALATALWFAYRKPEVKRDGAPWIATVMVVLYGVAWCVASPIFRVAIAVLTIGVTLVWSRGVRSAPGVLGLFVVALPITASLQFVAGFPMRLAASSIASWVLGVSGAAVTAEGTALRWNGGLVEVDVPCSGIRMLWAGLYFGLAAACACDAGWRRTCGIVMAAVSAVVIGNALRTAGLFYLEAGLLPVSENWAAVVHAGAGLMVFAGIAATTMVCARS